MPKLVYELRQMSGSRSYWCLVSWRRVGTIVLLVVMALAVEYICRLQGLPHYSDLAVPDIYWQTQLNPGDWFDSQSGAMTHVNRLRMRDREYGGERPVVLVLGSSDVYGAQLTSEETVSHQLELALAKHYGVAISVYNGGVPSWGSQQMLWQYRRIAPLMRPEVVLISGFPDDGTTRVNTSLNPKYGVNSLWGLLLIQSQALEWLSVQLSKIQPVKYIEDGSEIAHGRPDEERRADVCKDYTKLAKYNLQQDSHNQTYVVFLPLGSAIQFHETESRTRSLRELRDIYRRQRKLATDLKLGVKGVSFIDICKLWETRALAHDDMFYDDTHLKSWGAALVGEDLAKALGQDDKFWRAVGIKRPAWR